MSADNTAKKRAIFLYGDSHAVAYEKAQARLNRESPTTDFFARVIGPARLIEDFTYTDRRGVERLNPLLEQAMSRDGLFDEQNRQPPPGRQPRLSHGYDDVQVVLVLGTSEAHRQTLQLAFKNYRVAQQAAQSEYVSELFYIPRTSLIAYARNHLRPFIDGLKLLKKQCNKAISVMEAPPVTPDPAYIAKLRAPGASQADLERRAAQVPDLQFRRARWDSVNEYVRQQCKSLGVGFIDNPPVVQDIHGFLKQQYWLDGVHTNSAFAYSVGQSLIAVGERNSEIVP